MGTESSLNTRDTPGRVTRPTKAADQGGLWKWLPGLYVLRHYRMNWLRNDVVAGLVLTAVLVPVGMGYAEAAGLPADQRFVRFDRAAAGLCNLWSQPHHGSWTRFFPGGGHRGGGCAAGSRGSRADDSPGRYAGDL